MILRLLTLLGLCGWLALAAAEAPPPIKAPPPIDPAAVTYDDLPPDRGMQVPWAENPATMDSEPYIATEVAAFKRILATWPPARDANIDQRVQACLSLAALADSCRAASETEAAAVLFDQLQATVAPELLAQALARVALAPATITITTRIDAFALANDDREDLRWRMVAYAKKMLGRLLHKLP
jgi:hypothetical protein